MSDDSVDVTPHAYDGKREVQQCRPLRIVHIMPQIGIGGAETQLFKLITHSNEAIRHEVLYYGDSRDTAGYELYASGNVSLTRVPRSRRRPLQFIGRLAREIRRRQPDVVHCWLASGVLWGRLAALRAGVPHVLVAYRATRVAAPRLMRILERLTHKRVHHLANSVACARAVAGQLGIDAGRFQIVYNGVETGKFDRRLDRQALRRELGVSAETTLIVNVGRLTPPKNQQMLLRVARRCKGVLPVRFAVVGHGELEDELAQTAEELEVEGQVRFLGLRHDIPEILLSADIFCYTSLREGFPNALLEAMAAGLPIVTTHFPGADELIAHERNGLVVPLGDEVAMTDALRRYVETPELAARYGACAAKTARQKFSISRMVENTLALYHSISATG